MARKTRQQITITEAAKQGFASRPTLYRALKEGRLSAKKQKDGGTLVDVAELVRVFGEPTPPDLRKPSARQVSDHVSELEAERNALKAEIRRLEDALKREQDSVERERQQADKLMAMLENAQRQLTDQRPRRGLRGLFRGGD